MKSLADFKRRVAVGVKVHTTYHGMRIVDGKVVNGDIDKGVREFSIVQSNQFALRTPHSKGGFINSWCHWPKASELKINSEDSVTILENGAPLITYTFVKE
jgi:hypothetical protein